MSQKVLTLMGAGSTAALFAGFATVLAQRISQRKTSFDAAMTQSRDLAKQALYLDPLVKELSAATGIVDDSIALVNKT